ncbi:MAG: hypothetical protein B7Y25_00920 [Alphaproteobacteria bacterium 16-39-46]|nr:MAG: hypothetical protein B7Y25_00920 [Alphaproteobacteria bacterium 16-39-46]OZA44303.1 MAG: hypothetical protein B7X84_00880 [Alphaproteobacteria bacterium 17-39-52]
MRFIEHSKSLTIHEISKYLENNFEGLNIINAWGEKNFFYNPEGLLKRGVYFSTIKEKDGENDKASHLYREGIFRLNFGISKQTFLDLFQILPKRPSRGNSIEGSYDFKEIDILTPHPIYGWMAWVSVLNPSLSSFEKLKKLLSESYHLTVKKYKRNTLK